MPSTANYRVEFDPQYAAVADSAEKSLENTNLALVHPEGTHLIHQLSGVQKGNYRKKRYKFYPNYLSADGKDTQKPYSLSCSEAPPEDEPGSPEAE